jgi:hypothetical protein
VRSDAGRKLEASGDPMGTGAMHPPAGKSMKSEVTVAKNYLNPQEMISLEQIVSTHLDSAERRGMCYMPMTMENGAKHLDLILVADGLEYRSFTNAKISV